MEPTAPSGPAAADDQASCRSQGGARTGGRYGWSGEHRCLFGGELAGRVSVTDCGLVADAEYSGEVEWVGPG
jgi:hypothetical protein